MHICVYSSQQELYAIAVQALTQVERKVDAAYGKPNAIQMFLIDQFIYLH